MNGFKTKYSFNLYLDSPSNYYMNCTIPSSSQNDLQEITYIECKLDLLKFPLIEQNIINLPSKFPLEDINIINWEKLDKKYNGSGCNPVISTKFSPEKYEISCYKPYYNKLSMIGKIIQNNNNLQKEKVYSFEMNAIVDKKIALLTCELKSLDESLNNYQMDCITNGKNSVSFFKTFVIDDKNKELIYIQASHQYTMKECLPTKIITFKKTETKCSPNDNLFQIYFYADMEGFSNEETITLYLEQPAYAYMICKIPKSGESSDQYVFCTIDIGRFPLIYYDKIIAPSDFYIHPEWEIKNWESISKTISTNKCSGIYQYSFTAIKYFDIECYLNRYNSFIAEGKFEPNNNSNNNNLIIRKIKLETIMDSEYKTISCEIYPPDISNTNSRIYCYSNEGKSIKMFQTITQDENSKEKIFINMDQIYDIKECQKSDKIIYFKAIESECLQNESLLKILIYSDMVGFNNEEKININLAFPNPSYLECIIPKLNTQEYIECALDISKFPIITNNTIKLPDSFTQISNCYLSNWKNINKILTTGKCHLDYSLIFTPSKVYESKCYDKNYNAIALMGSLSMKEQGQSSISEKYSFNLNSIVNGKYDKILCDIYPPDASFSEHRIFCYINQINSLKIFRTMVNDDNNHQKIIYINITNYDFSLLDCSYYEKLIYFKGINLKYTDSFVNIYFYGKISGSTNEQSFSISLDEPNYASITCLFPSSESNSEDKFIECKYDLEKFPLINNDKIKFQNIFPNVQDYSSPNWNFINKYLYIGYQHKNYSLSFVSHKYVSAICYKKGYNLFSVVGSIELNDNNNQKNEIIELNNYVIIDGNYTNIYCKIYSIESTNNEYQMDCYTTGKLYAILFPTIASVENNQELILINSLNNYTLQNCDYEFKRRIDFKGNSEPQCLEDGSALLITFTVKTYGFIESEQIKLYANNYDNIFDIYFNFIIPVSRNGEEQSAIICKLDTQKFPLINIIEIYIFFNIENCEITNLDKIDKEFNIEKCYQPYELKFSDLIYNEQNCKSYNESIKSILGILKNNDGSPISSQEIYNFTLSAVLNFFDINEVSCELYPIKSNSGNYQMDCDLEVNEIMELYGTIIKDEINKKFIFIDKILDYIDVYNCTNYNKFINFNGKMEVKQNSESSQLELVLSSITFGFEKEETLRLILDYPKYSYMNCIIPSSKSNNNTFIKCILDTYKFPLTKEESIILPLELKEEKYSFTKWAKIKKELKDIECSPKYENIFYSYNNQNIAKCDKRGNNIITISGSISSNQTNVHYSFDVLGIVDLEYKSLNCNLDIKKENNEIICKTKGLNSSQIFQTMGTDSQTNDKILIKVNNYLDYNLTECHPSSSSKSSIFIIVGSILASIIIILAIFLIIRYIRKNKKSDTKINSLINELSEIQQ